jgi:hypothetical protein
VNEIYVCRLNKEKPESSRAEAAEFEILLLNLREDFLVGLDGRHFYLAESYIILPLVDAQCKVFRDSGWLWWYIGTASSLSQHCFIRKCPDSSRISIPF